MLAQLADLRFCALMSLRIIVPAPLCVRYYVCLLYPAPFCLRPDVGFRRKTNYKKKVTLSAKKTLNALCEKRLQSLMFKWTSFYKFLEFYCQILSSYAIYRNKKVVKILNCYLYAKKKYYGTLSKGAICFWPTLYIALREQQSCNHFGTNYVISS